jgi:hypothetical protein
MMLPSGLEPARSTPLMADTDFHRFGDHYLWRGNGWALYH